METNLEKIIEQAKIDFKKDKVSPETLDVVRKYNNPDEAKVGHYTGRCMRCHSGDLWDDATAYGCEFCGAIYFTGDMLPKVAPNAGYTLTTEQEAYNRFVDDRYGESE